MTEINRYHIFVNTALRSSTSASSSNFTIQVNPPLVKSNPFHYFTAQIASVEIPYAWTQINSTNNSLQIVYQGIYHTLTLSPGNYTVNTLISEYQYQLYKAVGFITWSDNTTYNQSTGILTFGIKGLDKASIVTYAIAINFPANPFLARMFGCLNNANITYGYGSILGTYQYINVNGSTNVNVNPVSSIYIRSSNLKQIKNQENMVAGYGQDPSDILCKMQVFTPPKTWIFYNGELGLSARVTNPIIDKMDIYLSDNGSFALNLNNNDWTFRITFVEYRPIDMSDAYMKTKDLNGILTLTHPIKIEQTPEPEEESETVPIVPLKRFQK